jgi:hypothetical protein
MDKEKSYVEMLLVLKCLRQRHQQNMNVEEYLELCRTIEQAEKA